MEKKEYRKEPLTNKEKELLKKVYYKDGYTLGRVNLYKHIIDKYKTTKITERQVGDWLKEQKLNQLYAPTRKGGALQSFKPKKPWLGISVDLIDFTNKPAKQYRYILVVIDNFSRFMYVAAITSKEADKTTKAMSKILDKIENDYNVTPSYALHDDGSEFKGEYIGLMKKKGIQIRRTLGGQPQSNGLVERANGKVKRVLAKNKKINGGTWYDNLDQAVKVYNDSINRTIGMTPKKGAALTGKDIQKLKDNVKDTLVEEGRDRRPDYQVGDEVRLKIAKGKLDKSSTPNWTEKIYSIRHVIKGRSARASTYLIKGQSDEKRYTRNDLQIVESTPQSIPQKKVYATRAKVKEDNAPRRSARLKK